MVQPKSLLDNGELKLAYEVWNDNTFSDDIIGKGVISVKEFFENRATKRCVPDVARPLSCGLWKRIVE